MRGLSSQVSTSFVMRGHVQPSLWLRRRKALNHGAATTDLKAESIWPLVGTA